MSDFRPMTECKDFNMERVLLKNKNGYMITAFFKDGMLQCDGDEDWTLPITWNGFIRLRDLANVLPDNHEQELKLILSELPKMRWNISEDEGYFGDEWDEWEHMEEKERFEYFSKIFSTVKKMKDIIENI